MSVDVDLNESPPADRLESSLRFRGGEGAVMRGWVQGDASEHRGSDM